MIELIERTFVAGDYACPRPGSGPGWEIDAPDDLDWAVIHACKSPCHQRAVGYRGNLDKDHPNYLILERGNDLYLVR